MRSLHFKLFLFSLLFAPLAFGTVETWSLLTLESCIGITAILYFLELRRGNTKLRKTPGIIPLTLFVCFIFLQTIPLPTQIVQLIAPNIYQAYEPILSLQQGAQWIPLTVNLKATFLEGLRIGSYGLFYILAIQFLSDHEKLEKTIRTIAWLAIAIAVLAIMQKVSSPDKIYWFRPTPPNAGPVGPWVYHNHFAGFMEMLVPLVLSLFLYYKPTVHYEEPLRNRIVSFFTSPATNLHFLFGFGLILIICSIFIAVSRGGVLSTGLSLLCYLLLFRKSQSTKTILIPTLLLLFLILFLTQLDWGPIQEKFSSTFNEAGNVSNTRLIVWGDSIELIKDFFFSGSGFGTFLSIYPLYSTYTGRSIYDHAHNDYIELLTDGGLVGFILCSWFVLSVLIHGWKKIFRRRDPFNILMGIGAFCGILALLFHSVTDFNMHNGANGLYFFLLCALLVSAGNTRRHFRRNASHLPVSTNNKPLLFLSAGTILLTAAMFLHGGIMLAENRYKTINDIYINPHLSPSKLTQVADATQQAIRYDSLEADYPYALANVQSLQNNSTQALNNYITAARLNPMEGIYIQRIGLLLTESEPLQAKHLMSLGYERTQNKEKSILILVEWLLNNNHHQEAVEALKTGMKQHARLFSLSGSILTSYAFNRQDISEILPESPEYWIRFGSFLEQKNNMEEAEYFRTHALDFLDKAEEVKPYYFSQLIHFYRRQKQEDKALVVLRKAIEWLPDHAPFHIALGDFYLNQGIRYRAKEEYKQALLLEPANALARKKLDLF